MKSIKVYIDESGIKQRASTKVQDPNDLGVAVALILPIGIETRFFSLLSEKLPSHPTDDTHITDLANKQEGYRNSVFQTINSISPQPKIVYEAISAAGYHLAEYEQFRPNFEEFQKLQKSSHIRTKVRLEDPSAHAALLEGVVLKARAVVTDMYGEDEVEIVCITDEVDSPILEEAQRNLNDFSLGEYKDVVKGYDLTAKQHLVGTITSKLAPEVSVPLCSFRIQKRPKSDVGVFAADIIANTLYYHLRHYVAETGCVKLNSRDAIQGFQLKNLVETASNDFSDLVYNH